MQIEHCEFPDGLLYDLENNVWVESTGGTRAKLGITSVHAALAGRISSIKFKPTGTNLKRNQALATLESIRYFGVVRTPIDCSLVSVNSRLVNEPKLANDSPYQLGWFAEIAWNQGDESLASLVRPKESEEKIREQIRNLRVRCFSAYPDHEMWEIGVECAAVLVRLNDLLDRCEANTVVHVVSDDPTADIEMERWKDQTRQEVVESRKEGNLMHFIVRKVR